MIKDQADPSEPAPRLSGREASRESVLIDTTAVNEAVDSGNVDHSSDNPVEGATRAPEGAAPKKSRKGLLAGFFALLLAGGGWAAWQSSDELRDLIAGKVAEVAPPSKPVESKPSSPTVVAQEPSKPVEPKPTPPAPEPSKPPAPAPVASPSAAPPVSPDALSTLEKKLEQRLAAIEAAAQSKPANAPAPNIKPLEDRLAGLEKRLQPLEASLTAPKTELRATAPPEASAPRRPDAAALAVVAQAISRSIDRGAPFPAALGAAQALGATPEQLASLRAVADKGAPSTRALADMFQGLSKAALAAAEPPTPDDASILDRLTSMLTKLVRVRPVGEAKGNDAPALVSRIEQALQRGSADEALAAWTLLPAPAKEATRGFSESARLRANAEGAAAALLAKSIDDLASNREKP